VALNLVFSLPFLCSYLFLVWDWSLVCLACLDFAVVIAWLGWWVLSLAMLTVIGF
jgi:hypothetical protein